MPTSGFSLAALPRSPQIPNNLGRVGEVDAREIYEAVRAGLQTVELAGQAPNRGLLANDQTRTALAEGEARRTVLPTLTAGTLADVPNKSRILAQDAAFSETARPLKERVLAAETKVKEAEATPEFLDAKLKHLLLTMNPAGVREFDLLTAGLPASEKERARRIHFGLDPRTSSAAIQYKEVVGADGKTRLVAVDPREVGAQVVGSGETYGSGVQAKPAATSSVQGVAPIAGDAPTAPQNPQVFTSPTAQDAATAKATGTKSAEILLEARAKLPKAQSSLQTIESKTTNVEQAIDEAINLSNSLTTGYGSILKNLPATDARKLEALLLTIKANIGFDALAEMRQNSPTGGALGNVSDYEGKTLQATIAALDQALSAGDLKEALRKVKEVRRESLTRVRNAYERDVDAYGTKTAASPQAPKFKIIEVK